MPRSSARAARRREPSCAAFRRGTGRAARPRHPPRRRTASRCRSLYLKLLAAGSAPSRALVHRLGHRAGRGRLRRLPSSRAVRAGSAAARLRAAVSLTAAFKVHFPIAGGSNMSVSYVVDIASLILRGPHATMIVGAAERLEPVDAERAGPQPGLPHALQHGVPGAHRAGRRTGVPAAGRHRDIEAADDRRARPSAWRSPTSSRTRCRSQSPSR